MTTLIERLRNIGHAHCHIAADTIETLQVELAAIHKEAETNQKWAFLEWRNKAEQLEVENLGLRLECQGLKAEIAEVKSYWKEAARKNAEMLAKDANRLGGGL